MNVTECMMCMHMHNANELVGKRKRNVIKWIVQTSMFSLFFHIFNSNFCMSKKTTTKNIWYVELIKQQKQKLGEIETERTRVMTCIESHKYVTRACTNVNDDNYGNGNINPRCGNIGTTTDEYILKFPLFYSSFSIGKMTMTLSFVNFFSVKYFIRLLFTL